MFAVEGAKVCVNFTAGAKEAAGVVREIESLGGEAISLKADVADEAEVVSMVDAAVKRFGRVDILVNNAGILRQGDLFTLKAEDIDAMLGVNVKGLIYCTREVGRHMLEQRYGKVVNVASNAALGTAFKGTTGYALTKAAVLLLTKRFALEFAGAGINRELRLPGIHRDRHDDEGEDDQAVRGRGRRRLGEGDAQAGCQAGRDSKGHTIPGERRVELHDRDDAGGRRRKDGLPVPRLLRRRRSGGAVTQGHSGGSAPMPSLIVSTPFMNWVFSPSSRSSS